ncbi:2Fe-2S iron-sulfur cluster-binding protein [Sphingomonas sp. DT-204]|uniref:2Fe-2S iron-sulfur cluster-binding protein n=1 Tax=Sphingomonas sp. DT-204 TaxID=3396166 RepID=UPI003F1C69AA
MTDEIRITRRELIEAGAVAPALLAASEGAAQARDAGVSTASVTLTVNGRRETRDVDTRTTVLDFLREHLGLTGSKKGCDHGQCGACTVILNGRRANACLTLAVMADGDEVTTIEGLGSDDRLHPMQEAFIKHDGFQCGYCTPGQICSAIAMLEEAKAGWPSHVTADVASRPRLDDDEIRERMSGNLCRCSCYIGIVAAIRDAGGVA